MIVCEYLSLGVFSWVYRYKGILVFGEQG